MVRATVHTDVAAGQWPGANGHAAVEHWCSWISRIWARTSVAEAIATASPVLAVRIAAAVSGDIFSQPELATALSLVMAVLLLVVIVGGRLGSAWLRRSA